MAFAPSEPRTHVRGHVWLVACAGTVVKTVVTTGRETVVRMESPRTSHVSAINSSDRADIRGCR